MKKILFVSHGNSLSGAPLVLLYFMQWLRQNHKNYQIDLLVLREGILSDDFRNVSHNYYSIDNLERNFFIQDKLPLSLQKRINSFLKKRYLKRLKNNNYDLIYANTVATLKIASQLKLKPECELILHVHELNTVISQIAPNFKDLKKAVNKFIAVSELVKNNLTEKWAVEPANIKIIYEFSKIEKASLIEKESKDEFLICGCGYVDWRKGTDLFIQVARNLTFNNKERKIKFIWIGKISFEDKLIIEADIEKMGLAHCISFVGEQLNPHEILKNCDVFLLPSREDPFPLVCIETAMLGKPIICFDKATGIAEVLKNGGGYVVPYLNVEEMTAKVEFYLENTEQIYKDGLTNQKNFANFTPEKSCPEIFDFINIDSSKIKA